MTLFLFLHNFHKCLKAFDSNSNKMNELMSYVFFLKDKCQCMFLDFLVFEILKNPSFESISNSTGDLLLHSLSMETPGNFIHVYVEL